MQSSPHFHTSRSDLVKAEAQATIDKTVATGVWEVLDGPPLPGDVVKVESEFLSGDERRTVLKPGDVGIVEALDAEGDATVHFPSLDHVKNKHR